MSSAMSSSFAQMAAYGISGRLVRRTTLWDSGFSNPTVSQIRTKGCCLGANLSYKNLMLSLLASKENQLFELEEHCGCFSSTGSSLIVLLVEGSHNLGASLQGLFQFAMESSQWWSKETVAVVTGANRGIGHETVRQLASKGITVILASRDEKLGRAAMEELHKKGLKTVDSHALDIADPDSVTGFAKWLKSTYGGLDILINNAAVGNFNPFTAELAIRDVKINYEGTKNVTETLLPLMKHSDAGARIVILSSLHGQLVYLRDDALREQLTDPNNFTEATLDSITEQYYAACKAGPKEAEKFAELSYQMSKILITAYSRVLAKRLASRPEGEKVYVNCADPGVVLTDAYDPAYGPGVTVDKGADTPVWLALHPKGGPSGGFFYLRKESSFVGTEFAKVKV